MTEEEEQRKILKRMAEAAQEHYETTGEMREGMKELGEAMGEDVLRQMRSPSPLAAAVAAVKAEKPLLAARLKKKAAKDEHDREKMHLELAATEEERRRQQEQDDYDASNNRRAAIAATKRRRAEREGLHSTEE
jgi:hypothetical protein